MGTRRLCLLLYNKIPAAPRRFFAGASVLAALATALYVGQDAASLDNAAFLNCFFSILQPIKALNAAAGMVSADKGEYKEQRRENSHGHKVLHGHSLSCG